MDDIFQMMVLFPILSKIAVFIVKLVIFILILRRFANYSVRRTAAGVKEALLDIQIGEPEFDVDEEIEQWLD